jgi:hypothetical protein
MWWRLGAARPKQHLLLPVYKLPEQVPVYGDEWYVYTMSCC